MKTGEVVRGAEEEESVVMRGIELQRKDDEEWGDCFRIPSW